MLHGARLAGSNSDLGFLGGAKMCVQSLSNEAVKSRSASTCFLFLGFLIVVIAGPFSGACFSSKPIDRSYIC